MTLQSLYTEVCYHLAENGGLVSGTVTAADFLNYAKDALTDFLQKTGIYRQLSYLKALAFTTKYTVSDTRMRVLNVFYDRENLTQTDAFSLDLRRQNWQDETDVAPLEWHEDRLPPKTIEVWPAAIHSGDDIPSAPIPESAADGNLLLIATAKQDLSSIALSTTIEGVPDSLTPYIKYRILQRIFTSNGECKNTGLAKFCEARYQEGLALAQSVMGEQAHG